MTRIVLIRNPPLPRASFRSMCFSFFALTLVVTYSGFRFGLSQKRRLLESPSELPRC